MHLGFSLLGLALIASTGFARAAEQPAAAVVYPGKAWQTATPESQGLDAKKVAQAIEHLKSVCGPQGTDEVMIVRHGYVIWQGPKVDNRHRVWSCTKSFLSTCLGLLWDDGKLTPDTPAHTHLPTLKKDYPAVTLRHIGTFTSGLGLKKGEFLTFGPPDYKPGAAFNYSSQSDVLAAILTRIAGKSLKDLFKARIAGPIGITDEDMLWEPLGEIDGIEVNGGAGSKAAMTINARAMARFGWMYCNAGQWNGKQLISSKYIDYATVPRTSAKTPPHDPKGWYVQLPGSYGLNWWTNGKRSDGKRFWPSAPDRTFAAQGNRNNVCFVVPDWKMVIVRLGTDKIIKMEHYDKVFELLKPSDTVK